jgi:hypothetical protein
MTRPAAAAIALLALTAASCQLPPPVPPPRFKPNPPYPPEIVEDPAPDDSQNRIDTPEPLRPGEYPVARPTANPNEVISPFPPYNLIDIEGFRTGQLARDPSNNRIFRVP